MRAAQAAGRRWAELFSLPLRHQRWRGPSGELAGVGVGSSLEFQDHRAYLPGDDPRQISWQAYARTGHYMMKVYREEARPMVDVTLDVSDSMFAFAAKAQRTVEAFYFVIEAARRSGAALRVYLVKGSRALALAEEAITTERWWEEKDRLPATSAHEVPSLALIPYRGPALRVLVSDLLFPGEPERVIHPLSACQGRGIIFAPICREESDPAWDGNYEFVEAESQDQHQHRIDSSIRRRYEVAYARHFELWKAGAAKYGILLARLAAEPDLGQALRAEAVPIGAVES